MKNDTIITISISFGDIQQRRNELRTAMGNLRQEAKNLGGFEEAVGAGVKRSGYARGNDRFKPTLCDNDADKERVKEIAKEHSSLYDLQESYLRVILDAERLDANTAKEGEESIYGPDNTTTSE